MILRVRRPRLRSNGQIYRKAGSWETADGRFIVRRDRSRRRLYRPAKQGLWLLNAWDEDDRRLLAINGLLFQRFDSRREALRTLAAMLAIEDGR